MCFFVSYIFISYYRTMTVPSTVAPELADEASVPTARNSDYVTRGEFGSFVESVTGSISKMTESITERMDSMSSEFTARMDSMATEMKAIASDVDLVKNQMNSMASDVDLVKNQMNSMASDVDLVKNQMNSMASDVDLVKNHMNSITVQRCPVTISWKPKRERPDCCIDNNEIHFVNRDIPLRRILDVFYHSLGNQPIRKVAVIHAAKGNGKTYLGNRFLDVCSTVKEYKSYPKEFKDTLGGARIITVDLWKFDPWREMNGTSRNCADALRDYFKIILDELLNAGELEGNTSWLGFPKSLFTVIHEFVAHTKTPLLLFLIILGRIPQQRMSVYVGIRSRIFFGTYCII
jgi:hypothetical protein